MNRLICTFLAASLLLLAAPAAAAESWWTYAVPPSDSAADLAIARQAGALLRQIAPPDGSATAKADAIRRFITENSVHQIDPEFYTYWHDMPAYIEMIGRHAASPSLAAAAPKPHMDCATRSAVMYHLVRAAGLRARFVVIQQDVASGNSHTFLEVFDPLDGRWTIHDPDAALYWRFADGRRAGTADLLRFPVGDTFSPCRAPDDCGYDAYTKLIVPLFAFAVLIDPQVDSSVPLLYNSRRVDSRLLDFYTANVWAFCAVFGRPCRYVVTDMTD